MLLAFATEIEADPFIDYHGLKKQNTSDPYLLYEKDNISLIITGMGSIKGAVYLSDTMQKKKREGIAVTKVINYGVAGCLTDKFCIGDIVEIDKVIKYNTIEFSRPRPTRYFLSSFPEIKVNEKEGDINILATSDHPIFTKEDSKSVARYAEFVDMEGYGYAFVTKYYNIPITLIKGISDFAFKQSEETFKQNVKKCLLKLLTFHSAGGTFNE